MSTGLSLGLEYSVSVSGSRIETETETDITVVFRKIKIVFFQISNQNSQNSLLLAKI